MSALNLAVLKGVFHKLLNSAGKKSLIGAEYPPISSMLKSLLVVICANANILFTTL